VDLTLLEYRRLSLMALWSGMLVVVGLVFAFIPNLELVTLTAFLGGIALGPRRGLILAVVGEGLFSAMNPIGSGLGFPILFLMQIFAIGLAGLAGGLVGPLLEKFNSPLIHSLVMAGCGLLLTLIYDLLTALSLPLSSGIIEGTLLGSVLAGMAFFVLHLVSNTLLFAIFGPGLCHLVQRQLLIHNLRSI